MANAFKFRDYRLLWGGFLISSVGDQMQQVAEDWLVFVMTGSPFLLGVVSLCKVPSRMFLAPVFGVIIDRATNRKTIMIAVTIFQLIEALVYGVLVTTKFIQFWHILVLSTLDGLVSPLIRISRQTVVPDLVPRESLFSAISLYSVGNQTAQVAGPLLSGILIAWVGVDGVLYINAISFCAIIVSVAVMRIPEIQGGKAELKISEELGEGMRFVRDNPSIMEVMATQFISFLVALPFTRLLPVYAKDILNIGPTGLGSLRGSLAFGSILGGLGLVALGNVRDKNRLLSAAAVTMTFSLILFSHARGLPFSLISLVIFGAGSMVYRSTALSVIQFNVPDQFRGRVLGLYNLESGFKSLGGLLYGTLASLLGTPITVAAGGAIFGFSTFVFRRYRYRASSGNDWTPEEPKG